MQIIHSFNHIHVRKYVRDCESILYKIRIEVYNLFRPFHFIIKKKKREKEIKPKSKWSKWNCIENSC